MLPKVECYGCGARAPAPTSPGADTWIPLSFLLGADETVHERLVCPRCLEEVCREDWTPVDERVVAWRENEVREEMRADDPETDFVWLDDQARVYADLTEEEQVRWIESRRAVWAEMAQTLAGCAWEARHNHDDAEAEACERVAEGLVEMMQGLDDVGEDDER
jgi:hypothetical protein